MIGELDFDIFSAQDIDIDVSSGDSNISIDVMDDGPSDIPMEINNGESTANYNRLYNKPSIEQHVLMGDSSLEDIGVEELTAAQTDALLN